MGLHLGMEVETGRRRTSKSWPSASKTFLQQVRSETAKVTWPSRRETMISTVMVLRHGRVCCDVSSSLPTRSWAWLIGLDPQRFGR
jgi:endonuclease III